MKTVETMDEKDMDEKWKKGPSEPVLGQHSTHLWRVMLSPSNSLDATSHEYLEDLKSCLSKDELLRAELFRFEYLKNNYIMTRGILRHLLSKYLSENPKKLEFRNTTFGKPTIADSSVNFNISFNLSHSKDCIVFALTNGHSIGIDIEYYKKEIEVLSIAKQFFSDNEYNALQSLTEEEQTSAFYKLWTRKEAFIKALGMGLSYPLHQIETSFLPNEEIKILRVEGSREKAEAWHIFECNPYENYFGAVVQSHKPSNIIGDELGEIQYFDW